MKRLIFLLLFSCTGGFNVDEYLEQCPYEFKYGFSHYLKVPVTINNYKTVYSVGDTIDISFSMPDSIFDLSRCVSFKIPDFPFRVGMILHKVDSVNNELVWSSGIPQNEVIIDDKYNFNFTSNQFGTSLYADIIYSGSSYELDYKVILKEPGRYLMLSTDRYMDNIGSGFPELNEEADSVEFEGRCPDTNFLICHVPSDSIEYSQFINEMEFIDKEINMDIFSTRDENFRSVFGSGSVLFEWSGFHGFDVVN